MLQEDLAKGYDMVHPAIKNRLKHINISNYSSKFHLDSITQVHNCKLLQTKVVLIIALAPSTQQSQLFKQFKIKLQEINSQTENTHSH